MSNGIMKRQNEESSIEMLAAQRQLYSDAKDINAFITLISVFLPLLCSFINLFMGTDSTYGAIIYLVSMLSVLVLFCFEYKIKFNKHNASYIQQIFDTYVYTMSWDEKLYGAKRNITSLVLDYSGKYLSRFQTENLKNWYPQAVDSKPLNEGILTCQRENVWWDVGLRKKYKSYCECIFVIIIVIVFMVGILREETVAELLYRLAFICPIFIWLINVIKMINNDVERLGELDGLVNKENCSSMEDLQYIQKIIFEHRASCYLIPDFFYNIFKDTDEDKAHRMAVKSYQPN